MKDFTLKDVARKLREDYLQIGVDVPLMSIYRVIEAHFQLIDRTMNRQGHDNIVMYNNHVTAIYKPYPKEKPDVFDSSKLRGANLPRSVMKQARKFAYASKTPEEMDLELIVDEVS